MRGASPAPRADGAFSGDPARPQSVRLRRTPSLEEGTFDFVPVGTESGASPAPRADGAFSGGPARPQSVRLRRTPSFEEGTFDFYKPVGLDSTLLQDPQDL